ncbi:MAG TPA: CAP-associated domain-containing protein [Bacillota bacterium]|nr:CAP-associated domain-containing protein [Bacillota bacterium]
MKKGIWLTCMLSLVFLFGGVGAAESVTQNIQVSMEPVHFYFNGEVEQSDSIPGYFYNGVASIPKAIIYQGTTYVPLRYFSEHLNQEVGWDSMTDSIWIGHKPSSFSRTKDQPIMNTAPSSGNSMIQVTISPYTFYFNGVPEAPSSDSGYFYNGFTQVPKGFSYEWSTYVPLRYLSEQLNEEVGWDQASRSIWVGVKPASFPHPEKVNPDGIYGISIGQTASVVKKIAGEPGRKDISAYGGYEWWIYNQDLNHYVQVGIKDDMVVDLYSNAPSWSYKEIQVGTDQDTVNQKLDYQSSISFTYDEANFQLDNTQEQRPLYLVGDMPVIIYLDKHNQNKVTAIRFITKDLLLKSKSYSMHETYYGQSPDLTSPTLTSDEQEQVARGNEQQILDLTNIARLRNNLEPLTWNSDAAVVGRSHSQDMSVHHYFDHVSATTGLNPFERMEQAGITYTAAGENIAEGYSDAIEAYEGWMNSLGHRKNILNESFTTLGVGVYQLDYSQEFVTP